MDVEVDRRDLHRVQIVEGEERELAPGEVRVRVEAFALSSNNITYAVFGDALRYWDFFPATTDDDASWGRVPVWGFGEVVASQCAEVAVGERLFGFFPMSTTVIMTPGRVDERGFTDVAEHRRAMASAYNRYLRTAADRIHRPDRADHQMLLYPLFFTAFLIDDFLADNDGFGAEQVVVSSASAKTSIGVAFLAHARGEARVVGLTSAANRDFVEGLGVYDEVRTYADVATLDDVASVFVDVAGDRDVLHAVHTRLGDRLAHSMTVGNTHWDHQASAPAPLPGPEPQFFFAPGQIAKRTEEWGQDGLDARVSDAWDSYADWVDSWIELRHGAGPDAVQAAYLQLLDGRADPRVGFICTMAATAADDRSAS